MSGRLCGVSAVVTGGGRGIGRGVVDAYVAEGAMVTVLERSAELGEKLVAEHGVGVNVVAGDATDPSCLRAAVALAQRAGRPHGQLTCCVGVHDRYADVRELTPEQLAAAAYEIWQVNVLSTLMAVNTAHEWLAGSQGSVTLTLSESAFHPMGGGVLYGSSKWALRGVVSHLATTLAPAVRVNGVAPGGTSGTKFGGLSSLAQTETADQVPGRDEEIRQGNRLGVVPTPADHAGSYVFLADPEAARVITSVVVNSDAGRL